MLPLAKPAEPCSAGAAPASGARRRPAGTRLGVRQPPGGLDVADHRIREQPVGHHDRRIVLAEPEQYVHVGMDRHGEGRIEREHAAINGIGGRNATLLHQHLGDRRVDHERRRLQVASPLRLAQRFLEAPHVSQDTARTSAARSQSPESSWMARRNSRSASALWFWYVSMKPSTVHGSASVLSSANALCAAARALS